MLRQYHKLVLYLVSKTSKIQSIFIVYVFVIHTDTSDILQWCFIHCCITQDGYKERENRITKLEGFINDQVAELDRMEGTLKQTVANKEILEKDYQKVNEQYSLAKVCAM